ncbi:signal peptidase subunit Spc3 [Schizosaccharomyces pombe]|uniref:Signal peptidase complex subunit 3 n=1 Tax=Schizosaccharomyces pombe (strain 972 / ATCC 24843) TaxID=284812 RepID=SPC3_SCHPO|nr:putative signal peptidase subunit Spc3 [Schizosaccharomyces pombe]Q10259.1 RecName: Full=Signal peptidase complex subunit 3; AltName: Full=Microsomal signal peptidase subunit 3 [Schizosaccharomyces pombe 972h-]CAA93582.1 signal peptidase subunit Spc3 (predicted) [Schizosaccharomyces pombe]|eukprot:NP_593225.1 putative signal peptidase subunit Spc3 [Schizosaccharomyces pombe]
MIVDTFTNRGSTFFSKLSTVLFFLCAVITFQGVIQRREVELDTPVYVHYAKYRSARFYHAFRNVRQQYAQVKFNMDADLSELWDWNTKHVVVYLVASYSTEKHEKNQVVVWDKILSSPEESKMFMKDTLSNIQAHPFNEYSNQFEGKNATYTLHWTVSPKMGFLSWGAGPGSYEIPFHKIITQPK